MRNPDRLDGFYDELKKIHKEIVPDWRFGQMIMNFERWYYNEKKMDIFYLEENMFLEKFKQFMKGDK